MAEEEKNAYILGTDEAELHRLGLQHQVWAQETQGAWARAGFTNGQTILDLGCGPGFCSKELAYIVGSNGNIIAVDKSPHYISFLRKIKSLHQLNIEPILADFTELELLPDSLDAMYCRWALAWPKNPKEILQKIYPALKPGAKMVIHEYYDWSTHQTEPAKESLNLAIAAALKSFKEGEGEIDIGRYLPALLEEIGMDVLQLRPIQKLARPGDLAWQWPTSFYSTYFPRLVEYGYLSQSNCDQALEDINEIANQKGATLNCPLMFEIIAQKK